MSRSGSQRVNATIIILARRRFGERPSADGVPRTRAGASLASAHRRCELTDQADAVWRSCRFQWLGVDCRRRRMCYDCKDIQTAPMPFLKATRLRKGMLIKVGNDLFRILELHHLTPGNKRAHIQVRMRNIRTLALADHKFRAEEDVERATLDEREMQYLYDDEPVGIELPPTVDLVVKETVPGIKGATASNQIKPATLETGLVIQVPPFVNEGDKVRVNTETGEYQSRV